MDESGKCVLVPLNADNDPDIVETDSFCFNCHGSGITRLMLTRIPYFREVVISSFSCPHCGFENRTIDPAGCIQTEGKLFRLNVRCPKDLNRRLVQASHSEIRIPSLASSFPTSNGTLTTIEGALTAIIDNLANSQPDRRKADPLLADRIVAFIGKLHDLLTIKEAFDLELDDPSGTGFIENLHVPLDDPQLTCTKYKRTQEQNELLGYQEEVSEEKEKTEQEDVAKDLKESISVFEVDCPNCHSRCVTNMKVIEIPHFKEVIIMAVNCDFCGYRDNEVKSVAGISSKGIKFRLLIGDEFDLSRDVLKGDDATVNIPELDFTAQSGTLGSRFTTVEGLLVAIHDQLQNLNPFLFGDSADQSDQSAGLWKTCADLTEIIEGKRKNVHLEMTDPTGNSYLQALNENGVDRHLEISEFDRTFEQNEELGLNDIQTENY